MNRRIRLSMYMLLSMFLLLSGCSSVENQISFETDTAETLEKMTDLSEYKVSYESPNSLDATILVQCEKEWEPLYRKIAGQIEVDYPNSEIELLVIDTNEHTSSFFKEAQDIRKADVFTYDLKDFPKLIGEEKLEEVNVQAINALMGIRSESALAKISTRDGKTYGYPMGIKTFIRYTNYSNAKSLGMDENDAIELTDKNLKGIVLPLQDVTYLKMIVDLYEQPISYIEEDIVKSPFEKTYYATDNETKAFLKSIFLYWKQNKNSPVWDQSSADLNINDSEIIVISSSEDISNIEDKENILTKPLSSILFNGKTLKTRHDGYLIGYNSVTMNDEEKKLLAELFIGKLLDPIEATHCYSYTSMIGEATSVEDYKGFDEGFTNYIDHTLQTYNESKDFDIDSINENQVILEALGRGIQSWDQKNPWDYSYAYSLVQNEVKKALEELNRTEQE